MKTTDSQNPTLHWELFIRRRNSATQGVPPGNDALTWVANTVTLIWGERDALLVDTFLGDAQTTELADWIEAKGRTLRTIYLTHGHPDHFFGLNLLLQRFPPVVEVASRCGLALPSIEIVAISTRRVDMAGGHTRAH